MHVRLLGPCFKTGRLKPLCQHPKRACKAKKPSNQAKTWSRWVPQSQPLYMSLDYNTPRKVLPFQTPFPMIKTDADLSKRKYTQPKSGWLLKDMTDFKRFPFNNFTYCLTLFSKFFSSFPHGTCALSVSRQYLALDGIYHPFSAAFPNNTTRREHITKAPVICAKDGIVTLYDVLFQETYAQASADNASLNYNSDCYKNSQILNLSSSLFTRSY